MKATLAITIGNRINRFAFACEAVCFWDALLAKMIRFDVQPQKIAATCRIRIYPVS
ncbi:hypothetical protein BN873_150281 [Candidatus Competibacter denitrificans Run_A_D11]|uniref:Uncharacterized protein n=1 Tax=Candidatus Competibacter denitrificans Run_A_D11 TaxID=1400863 RepID=W6MBS8_9GAMM|nr:hypothetical protein BN873_150281 [Candidatus Competibacter denitrificans Run_A_D11]